MDLDGSATPFTVYEDDYTCKNMGCTISNGKCYPNFGYTGWYETNGNWYSSNTNVATLTGGQGVSSMKPTMNTTSSGGSSTMTADVCATTGCVVACYGCGCSGVHYYCNYTYTPVQIQASLQNLVPSSLQIVANDTTTTEATCGNGSQCGMKRSFTYQVYDQNGNPLQVPNLAIWDTFGTPSPNGLNLLSFTTTCGGTGPCGPVTDSNGRFQELSLNDCASVCFSNMMCTTGGGASTSVTQTWHVGPTANN